MLSGPASMLGKERAAGRARWVNCFCSQAPIPRCVGSRNRTISRWRSVIQSRCRCEAGFPEFLTLPQASVVFSTLRIESQPVVPSARQGLPPATRTALCSSASTSFFDLDACLQPSASPGAGGCGLPAAEGVPQTLVPYRGRAECSNSNRTRR